MTLKLLIYQDFQVYQGGQGTEQDIMSFIRKACSHVGFPMVLLILALNQIAEIALMLFLSLFLFVSLSGGTVNSKVWLTKRMSACSL